MRNLVALIIIVLICQVLRVTAFGSAITEDTMLFFTRSPFRGKYNKGEVVPVDPSRQAARMITPESKFTIAKFRSSTSHRKSTGMFIQIFDEKQELVFSHHFNDDEAYDIGALRDYNMIEPLSYANMRIAFSWKAKIDDVAYNVGASSRPDLILYTIILPSNDKSHTFRFEMTPIYGDRVLAHQSVRSQQIITVEGYPVRHLSQDFRGVFVRKTGVFGGYFVPSIPNWIMRNEKLNHDVLIEDSSRNHFSIGTFKKERSDWMMLSFYQFKPFGQTMPWAKRLLSLRVSLKRVGGSEEEFLLHEFKDDEAPLLDRSLEKSQFNFGKKSIGLSHAKLLAETKPPSWAYSTNGYRSIPEIKSAHLKMPRNEHGGVIPLHLEKQNGHVHVYAMWIKFSSEIKSGRYHFKFENLVNIGKGKIVRETYSDDFLLDYTDKLDGRQQVDDEFDMSQTSLHHNTTSMHSMRSYHSRPSRDDTFSGQNAEEYYDFMTCNTAPSRAHTLPTLCIEKQESHPVFNGPLAFMADELKVNFGEHKRIGAIHLQFLSYIDKNLLPAIAIREDEDKLSEKAAKDRVDFGTIMPPEIAYIQDKPYFLKNPGFINGVQLSPIPLFAESYPNWFVKSPKDLKLIELPLIGSDARNDSHRQPSD